MRAPRRSGGRGRLAATVTAAGMIVSMVSVSCTAAPPSTATPSAHASGSRAVPGAQLWVARYDGPAGSYSGASAIAVSPDGSAVFIAGSSGRTGRRGHNIAAHYVTVGYDSATGRQLWARLFRGLGDSRLRAIAVSPDGRIVFVTGSSTGAAGHDVYATIAYSASTGRQLWLRTYTWPGGYAEAMALVVSPDGTTVFVTGYNDGFLTGYPGGGSTTIAYNAATGDQRWLSVFKGNNEVRDIAISPDGKTLYVTGRGYSSASNWDYVTVAYDAATGAARWVARYNGPANGLDYANAVVVAPGGKSVYVAGGSWDRSRSTGAEFATVAYNAVTGAQRWVARSNGQGIGMSLAVIPNGSIVIVAGPSVGPSGAGLGVGYATVAYNAATGAAVWTGRVLGYPGIANINSHTLAVSPDSSTLYVSGVNAVACCDYDYATVAYATATGTQLWLSTYNGPGNKADAANALALSPDGSTLYVTGVSSLVTSGGFATIAYQTEPGIAGTGQAGKRPLATANEGQSRPLAVCRMRRSAGITRLNLWSSQADSAGSIPVTRSEWFLPSSGGLLAIVAGVSQ
jgi:WD40 repeat protein